jgi:hypothetical protein
MPLMPETELANLPSRDADATANELRILSAMGTDQLRKELSRAIELTARNLMRLALIVRALEERGEDLSDLKLGLLSYLRQIAYGSVLPEVVVRFAESPSLVKAIAALPAPDQARLAAGESVPLVVARGEHGHDVRRADPLRMTAAQVRQVFGQGRLRDEAEQILVLEGEPARVARGRTKAKIGSITVDRRNGGLVIGREFVAAAQVVEALAILAEGSDEDEDNESYSSPIMTQLTISQHDALKDAARRGRTNVARLVRRALSAYGLFAPRG